MYAQAIVQLQQLTPRHGLPIVALPDDSIRPAASTGKSAVTTRFLRTILLGCLALLVQAVQAQTVVTVAPQQEHIQLNPSLQLLPASQAPAAAGEVINNSSLPWQEASPASINLGLDAGTYWLRVGLHNSADDTRKLLVVVDYPSINQADLYIQRNGALNTLYASQGAHRPFSERPYDHRKLISPLNLAPGEQVMLLWRVDSRPLFRFRAELWQEDAFFSYDQHRSTLYGMLYGALAVMAIYNLFLALSVRERSYFYYVIYLTSTALLLAGDEGHLAQYLWADRSWPRLEFYALSFAISVLTFFLFSAHFLKLRRQQLRLYQGLLLVTIASEALIFTGGILTEAWAIRAALGTTMLLYLGALVAGVRLRLSGVISAGHYVLAILSMVLGLIATNLANLGLLPHTTGIQSYAAIGTVLMLVFFSLALADRINQLRKENLAANTGIAKANEETQRINAELNQAREERQRLEQTMAQTRSESRAKSGYLATISHQIRTPMNGMLGMADLLKETSLDSSQLHYVHTIERSGRALVEIVSELLDFADIESGKLALAIDPFDLETVVDDCLSILSLAAVEKRLNLIADIDPDLPRHLRGDARKLQQVLLNLLGNAIKFTDEGDVVLRVRRSQRPAVNSVELRFEITDTGCGINPELIPHLFTPFTTDDKHNTEGRGTGLGLPISKQLVELMDGQIGVDSTPGEGSMFWFTARCLVVSDQEQESRDEQLFVGRRILVVEAHPILAESLERTLQTWGAKVDIVTDADAAEQALVRSVEQARLFDAALIDHQLPSGSGLTLAAEIAKSDLATPPMVLMTAMTQTLNNRELDASGIDVVLEKPLTHHQLQDALQRTLGQARRRQQPVEPPTLPLQGMRVLVAEDNSVNQMVVATMLRKLGAEPEVVADGLAAVMAVQQQPPDAILMDCEMPELDGYQAARQIRNWERREGRTPIAIIALSAHATSDHRERARAAGIDEYLTKPVARQALEGALRDVRRRETQKTEANRPVSD